MTQAVICDQGVIDGDDVIAISWLAPEHEWDSGYALFSRPHDTTDSGGLIHLDCILDIPNIAAGMQLARQHGVATRTPDGWVPDGHSHEPRHLVCSRTERLQVHHKDGNTGNNNFDNLELRCRNCHRDAHLHRVGRRGSQSAEAVRGRTRLIAGPKSV